jgi:thiol-disulfide isomerase/thioredoxin
MSHTVRRADPYRDTDVIDSRAPRTNQAIVGTLSLLAVITGWWPILGVVAGQLAIGLAFGRRYCVPCLLYFEVIQPRIGEGPIEDSRPPRFANVVGAIFLTAATLSYLAGLAVIGVVLAGIVAALALLAAITGLCVGCEMYRLAARVRGIRARQIDSVDLVELGALPPFANVVVEFTHPLCTDCRTLEAELRDAGRTVVTVDVSRRPELARKYGVTLVPTAVAVAPSGVVLERLA